MSDIFLTDEIRKEIEYFKKLHESFSVKLGKKIIPLHEATDEVLYMLLSASVVMDISEDELFESFVITDKSLTKQPEVLIDAYAFTETENTKEKILHVFQFKLHKESNKSASPKELYSFADLINKEFLHPDVLPSASSNVVVQEMKGLVSAFCEKKGNRVTFNCHYITNAKGINSSDKESFSFLNQFTYDKQAYGFDVQVYGIEDIRDLCTDGKIKVGKEIIVAERDYNEPYRYEDNTGKVDFGLPGKVFIGMVNINELLRLQNKYHQNQLYSENIRLYLGNRGSVNKDIIKTITSEESLWFPYMNNGISIICDKLELGTPKENRIELTLSNLQIINGWQTVNALYNAKYSEETKDNFRASKVLVKVFQLTGNQKNIKNCIIKATNNQNGVKLYSLVSNDPIQIKIQDILKKLDYIYDRKGEAKELKKTDNVISMADSAIAYKAIYMFEAKQLRSGTGKGKIFRNDEYKKLYKNEYLEDEGKLIWFSVRLLIASLILTKTRELINLKSQEYIHSLKIINKSLYYISAVIYAENFEYFRKKEEELIAFVKEDNIIKVKNIGWKKEILNTVSDKFETAVDILQTVYDSLKESLKADTDNLLKSSKFNQAFLSIPAIKSLKNEIDE